MATDINRTTSIALPGEVSSEILQKTQESSAVMSLAQPIKLPGLGVTIPVITGDPEAAWVAETAKKPVKRGTLDTKIMQPYTLAVIVPFSNQFRRDVPALYKQLVSRLPLALAQKFDATVFGGVTAPGSNFDTLKSCTAQEIGTDAYAGLVAADADIADHNGILNGWVLSRTLQSKGAYLSGTPNVVGFAGDWTQAMYGTVEGVQIAIADQATLQDGETTINLFQQNMFAVRAEIEVGFRCDTTVFNKLTKAAG